MAKDDSLGDSVKQVGVDFDWRRIRFLQLRNNMNLIHLLELVKIGGAFVRPKSRDGLR